MSEDHYLPPTGDFLKSVVNDNLEHREVFGELIDNSIDANAKVVTITIGDVSNGRPKWVRAEDDGEGCGSPLDMIQLGKHTDHKTTLLGRFGIGAKSAMLWLGGMTSSVRIRTTRDAVTRRLGIDWTEYAKAWKVPAAALEESRADDAARGTMIELRPCIRKFPEGAARDRLFRELGYLYSPAIKRGVQIKFRFGKGGKEAVVLQRWELPAFAESIKADISVDGRGASVHVGIVEPGQPIAKPGITYGHGFRVIKQACGMGCGGLDYSKISGYVMLDDTWELTKNKDDISQHKEELAAAVFDVVRPLLEKAAALGQEIQFAAFNGEVERQLGALIGGNPDTKGARRPGATQGSVKPKNTGRKHTKAENEQPGETFRRRFGSLRVSYQNLEDPERIGQHSDGLVILNTAHQFVARIHEQKNAEAVVAMAIFVFLESVRSEDKQGQRRFRYEVTGDIIRDVGKILSAPACVDGRPLLSVVGEQGAA